MPRRYYSSRKKVPSLTIEGLYWKLQNLYLLFRDKNYFMEKAGITKTHLPDAIKNEAAVALPFQPFPITKWVIQDITEDQIFDTLEFLYDHVSKPGEWVQMISDTGFCYDDYDQYYDEAGRSEFREKANAFLGDYEPGYELMEDGAVLSRGTDGLQYILDAEIIPYDEANVDSKVRGAILSGGIDIRVFRKRRRLFANLLTFSSG